jgi:PAS domain S-box-containing protein
MSLSKLIGYFQTAREIESLSQLRQRILDRFLLGVTIIGSALFAISWIPLYQKGLFTTIVLYGVIYIFTLLITFIHHIPYGIRVGGFLLLFYLFGVINLSMSGFNVDAGLFLLAMIVMAILLIGQKGGLAAIGLSAFTIGVMGFLITEGTIKLSLGLPQGNPLLWIIGGSVFLTASFLLILGYTAIVNGLETNLAKANSLSKTIEDAYIQQRDKDTRYRVLIEGSTDIITILDHDGTVKYASPSVEMVLGYTPQETTGMNLFNLIHPEDKTVAYDALGPNVPAEVIGPRLELRLKHKDGTWRDLEIRGREMYSTPGIEGTIVNCRDITIRKQAQAELRESTLFLERMFSGLSDGVFVSDAGTSRINNCNSAALEIFGYFKNDLVGKTIADLFVDQKANDEFIKQRTKAVGNEGVLTHFEYQMKHRDGKLFPVEINAIPVNDHLGMITSWVSVVRDISEQKKVDQLIAEEREALRQNVSDKTTELQKTNERLRELVVLSSSVIYSISANNDFSKNFITENIQTILGYSSGEFLADPKFWVKHIHPEDQARSLIERKIATERNGGVFEYRFMHRDGSYRWIHDEVRTIRDAKGNSFELVGSWYDITERKMAEEALRASEIKYRTLYTSMMDAFVSVDMEGRLIEFNDLYQNMLGYAPEELYSLTYRDLTPPKWHTMEAEIVEKQILKRGYSEVYEKENIRKDGTIFPVELRTVIIRDETGKPVGMWAAVRDISVRKRIENSLYTSEERYRTLAEAAHDMIFIIDNQHRIQYVNTFAARSFHSSPKELIGRSPSNLFLSTTTNRQRTNLARVFQTGEALYVEEMNEFPGRSIWLSTWLVPLKDASGKPIAVLGVSRDITEKKKAEQTLLRFNEQLEEQVDERTAELVASQVQLRNLANQIVRAQEDERRRISRELHDEAGQALISLKYNLGTMRSELPERYKNTHQKLDDSVKIIDRTMSMIRNLSHSLRPPVMDVGGLNLSLRELCWDFSQRTGLEINYQGEDIPGLPDEIGISLFRFAQEATVNILKHAKATKADVLLQYKKGNITLTVRDNGKGIDPSHQSDGIGLLGIEERIDLLGGSLFIQSKPGRGVRLMACVPWTDVDLTV